MTVQDSCISNSHKEFHIPGGVIPLSETRYNESRRSGFSYRMTSFLILDGSPGFETASKNAMEVLIAGRSALRHLCKGKPKISLVSIGKMNLDICFLLERLSIMSSFTQSIGQWILRQMLKEIVVSMVGILGILCSQLLNETAVVFSINFIDSNTITL